MGECAAVYGKKTVGRAVWYRQGLRQRVEVRCPFEPEVFYRAFLEADGERWLIGLMVPREDTFFAARLLSAAQTMQLERAAQIVCRIERSAMDGSCAESETNAEEQLPTPSEGKRLEPPGMAFSAFSPLEPETVSDPLLARLAAERGDLQRAGDWLALPCRPGADPMAPFFCLMLPSCLGAEKWYLLHLQNGFPVSPQIRQESHSDKDKLDGVME